MALTFASEHMLANHQAPNSKYTICLVSKIRNKENSIATGAVAVIYADVLARRKRPVARLTRCKDEKATFRKPAKSRLAVRPMGQPQKRSPAEDPSVIFEDIEKGTASEPVPQRTLTPIASQAEPDGPDEARVQELEIWVKDKIILKSDQKTANAARILILCEKNQQKHARNATKDNRPTAGFFNTSPHPERQRLKLNASAIFRGAERCLFSRKR
jgi:hypothetical protein